MASGGFDPGCFPHLLAAEDRHFWFRARNAVLRAAIAPVERDLPPGYRVLEIGCGTGNTLRVLEAACRRGSVVGLDPHRQGLAAARRRVACPVVAADLSRLPFAPSVRFDLIAMFDVLEHIPDEAAALEIVRARLRPGGALVLTVPAGPELWGAFDEAARHCRRYTSDHLADVLRRAGLEVRYLSPFMGALYPLAWLKRRVAARRRPANAVVDELTIVPIVNGWLAWLLAREARPIAARRRLRFGTSILAVAGRAFTPPAA